MKYLHTMIRVSDIDETLRFFDLLGLEEQRRFDVEEGRFTLVFLAAPGDEEAQVELTHNWPPEDGSEPEQYDGGRNFGHLAYAVDDIYETCQRLFGRRRHDQPATPRWPHAFVRSPDNISVELLQKGQAQEHGRAVGVDGECRRMVGFA